MREAVVLALCLSSCAKAQPFGVVDIQDLATAGTDEDLAADGTTDLAALPARRSRVISGSGSAYAASADHLYTSAGSGRLGPAGGAVGLFNGLTKIDSMGWGSAAGSYVEGAAAAAPGGQGCSRLPD